MAVTSWGYNGPLFQENWARLASQMGARHVVDPDSGSNPFGVTAVEGSRRISVGAGAAVAAGVLAELPTAEIIDLPTIAAGSSRIYLVVLRRTWGEAPASSIELVYHSGFSNTTPRTTRPTLFPSGFNSEPGVVDDQPLAWVWFNGSNNTVQTWDIRSYPPRPAPLPTTVTTSPLGRTQEWDEQSIHTEYVAYVTCTVIVNVPTRVSVEFTGYWSSRSTLDWQAVRHRLVHTVKGTMGGVDYYSANNYEGNPSPGVPVFVQAAGFITLEPGTHTFQGQMYRLDTSKDAFIQARKLLIWEV